MSGGGLDDPPLPVPHSSPKHQPMGSPRHQAPTSQQSPLHKPTSQQGPKSVQPQMQKPQAATGSMGPLAHTATKQPTDTKTTTPATAPVPTTETPKQPKPTEEKTKIEPENQTAKETKPSQKKGEQIIPIKDIKKSRHYDVSQIFFVTFLRSCVVHCMLTYGESPQLAKFIINKKRMNGNIKNVTGFSEILLKPESNLQAFITNKAIV